MTKNTQSIRKSDAAFIQPIQSSRYLEINDDWFFFTREKDLLGPYRSKTIAQHAVKVYINKIDPEEASAQNTKSASVSSTERGEAMQDNVVYFKHPNWNL